MPTKVVFTAATLPGSCVFVAIIPTGDVIPFIENNAKRRGLRFCFSERTDHFNMAAILDVVYRERGFTDEELLEMEGYVAIERKRKQGVA